MSHKEWQNMQWHHYLHASLQLWWCKSNLMLRLLIPAVRHVIFCRQLMKICMGPCDVTVCFQTTSLKKTGIYVLTWFFWRPLKLLENVVKPFHKMNMKLFLTEPVKQKLWKGVSMCVFFFSLRDIHNVIHDPLSDTMTGSDCHWYTRLNNYRVKHSWWDPVCKK